MEKKYYFVVLQLPAFRSAGIKGEQPAFISKAVSAIKRGRAKIISMRADTGIADELRAHAAGQRFRNYLIFGMQLCQDECNDVIILNKAVEAMAHNDETTVIDRAEGYCLMAV